MVRNPYSYGTIVKEEQFFGRQEELQRLETLIMHSDTPQHCSIVGETGIGKSSLLRQFTSRIAAERADLIVLTYDMSTDFDSGRTSDFYRQLVFLISRDLCTYTELDHTEAYLAANNDLPMSLMTRHIKNYFRNIHKAGYWLLLVLDEFDNTTMYFNFDQHGWKLLRALGNDQDYGLCYLFASKSPIELLERNANISSNLASIFETIRLKLMPETEASALIDQPIKQLGMTWTPLHRKLVLNIAGYHPYCLQMACSYLFQQLVIGKLDLVTNDAQVISVLRDQYWDLFSRQREHLERYGLFDTLIRLAHGAPVKTTDRQIDELVDLGYLLREGKNRGRFRPSSLALDYYLKACGQQMALWPMVEETEVALYQLVDARYQAEFGNNWQNEERFLKLGIWEDDSLLPNMLIRWDERRQAECANPFIAIDLHSNLIQYASINDLKLLIGAHPELFQDVFLRSNRRFEQALNSLHSVRADVGRYRRISDSEVTQVESYCQELTKAIQDASHSGGLFARLPQTGKHIRGQHEDLESGGGTDHGIEREQYVDFDLYVSPDGYVRARSIEGERTGTIAPYPPDDVDLVLSLIEENRTREELLKNFGRKLYRHIFPDPIHTHLSQTEAVARSRQQKVRIRLTIKPDALASLPWEFTYREEGGYFLAINPNTVLSHYLDLPLPPRSIRQRAEPLHLLIILAEPIDQPPLDVDHWQNVIIKALAKPLREKLLTVKVVKHATFDNINKALLERKPDIIQFIGHGIYQRGKGYLALVDDNTKQTWKMDDTRFANLFLGASDNLGLVCLVSCESAKSDSPRSFLGIAQQIVQRGIPAVIAMQYKIQFSSAEIFLNSLYSSLVAHKPIDWAVQQARNSIALIKGQDNREFATPVLHMRAGDGVLF